MTDIVPYAPLPRSSEALEYELGEHSARDTDVPEGETLEFRVDDSGVYPGTLRKVWLHTPAGVQEAGSIACVVFQDGHLYLDPDGPVRAGIVLDNLVAKELIPPTVGIFVDPGVDPSRENPKNRNLEYDAFDDRYADFIEQEVLPRVLSTRLKGKLQERMIICGGSSGGNCSFTAAWHRPDLFCGVISFLASFPQIPGGNPFPELIARHPNNGVRVFLQTAQKDLNWGQPINNWFAENLRVAAALDEAGHDLRLVVGHGGHSPNHGGVLLPDALRWMLNRS